MRAAALLGSLALGLGLLATSPAHAGEYRVFTLTDGRVLVAEVLETQGTGLRVRTPQGETFVSFAVLADMTPVDEAKFEGQDDLYIYVAADETYRSGFEAAYRALPEVQVLGDAGVLTAEQQQAATACDLDLECLVDVLDDEDTPWMWVVVGDMQAGDAVFEGAVTTGSTRTRAEAPRVDFQAVNAAAYDAIQITPTAPPTPVTAVGPEPAPEEKRPPITRQRVLGMSFVPVPGYPSLVQGDPAGFGVAMAAVVPVTALWVGATGSENQSPVGHALLGLGGYYAATVLANQALGLRTLERGGVLVGVAPTERGGAALQVTVAK